jgi:hypothetical protein
MNDIHFISDLSSIYANIRKVDARKINLKGKNILEYISDNKTEVKHAQDTRETVTENDLWGQWVETLEDGTVIVHDDWITNPNGTSAWNTSITKIVENKAYIGDEFYANIQTERIKNGRDLFSGCSNFDFTIENLMAESFINLEDGSRMFKNCSNLSTWKCDSNKLSIAFCMFDGCSNLTQAFIDFKNIINAGGMFSGCSELTKVTAWSTNNLQSTGGMFRNCPKAFEHFNWKLPNVTGANQMFQNCTSLKSFSSDLPLLQNGTQMFEGCSNLSSFSGCLSSLTSATLMFHKCKLDTNAVLCIINTINDLASISKTGQLTIGIDVTNDANTIEQQLQTFAEGTLFNSWADLKQAFVDKGWTVTWQYGGSSTSITYDLRDGERIIPCPVYTKLIEILPQEGEELTEEEKNMATYCNEDGTKFYNIEWGHDVTHPEEFQQFDSLETACVSYGVMPKEYLETEGQTTLF